MKPSDLLRGLLDATIVRLVRYVDSRVHPVPEPHEEVIRIVTRRAAESSADYIEAHLDRAQIFHRREQVWDYALSKVTLDGLYAEFGVFEGHSINHVADRIGGKTIYGFDSFEGLKEDWAGTWYGAGHFTLHGKMPAVRTNVTLIKGWFDATVPSFLVDHPDKPFAFLHLDADTYESTKLVLALLADRIVSGTVVVFDDYLGFTNWRNGEHRAWKQFVAERGLTYRYLAFGTTPTAVLVV